MISLIVNNIPYTNFTEATFSESLDSISGSFSFSAVSTVKNEYPFGVGDPCQIEIDGETKLTGYIDVMSGEYDAELHTIRIQGRDKTEDLIDSCVEDAVDFSSTISLKSITETLIAAVGITGMTVSVEGTIEPFAAGEVESLAVGEPIFDFLEKYARKRQVFLATDGLGNVVYTRNKGIKTAVQLINNGIGSNIKRANFLRDHSNRFYKYIVRGQQNPTGLFAVTSATDVTDQKSDPAFDATISRKNRTLAILSESASDKDKATARAKWEADIRRSRSVQYTATVQGHSHENGVWGTNQVITVQDIFAPALSDSGEMLVNDLTFTYNIKTGSETTINLVSKDAYTLTASEPVAEKEVDLLAGLFG